MAAVEQNTEATLEENTDSAGWFSGWFASENEDADSAKKTDETASTEASSVNVSEKGSQGGSATATPESHPRDTTPVEVEPADPPVENMKVEPAEPDAMGEKGATGPARRSLYDIFAASKASKKNNHRIEPVTLFAPTWCSTCNGFLYGFSSQGKQCSVCQEYLCDTCAEDPASRCTSVPTLSTIDTEKLLGPSPEKVPDLVEKHVLLLSSVEKGDISGMDSLIEDFDDKDQSVRLSATEALKRLAGKANEYAITKVIAELGHENATARRAAVEALGKIAEKDEQIAVEAVCPCLKDKDWYVRHAAVNALGQLITYKGNKFAIDAASSCIGDTSGAIRKTGTEALRLIADVGNPYAISAVSSHFDHKKQSIREAAIETLCEIAGKGNDEALVAVRACLEDKEWIVRRAAVKAIGQLAKQGDPDAIVVVKARLDDDSKAIRDSAKEALELLQRK